MSEAVKKWKEGELQGRQRALCAVIRTVESLMCWRRSTDEDEAHLIFAEYVEADKQDSNLDAIYHQITSTLKASQESKTRQVKESDRRITKRIDQFKSR